MPRKARVLIVDDSAIIRKILTRELSRDPEIEVVGSAPDAYVARDKILSLEPDVITLDVEMPRMDGIAFLRKLMASHPMPVIVVSSVMPRSCAASIEALELGAIDVIEKPSTGLQGMGGSEFSQRLSHMIKTAAQVRLPLRPAAPQPRPAPMVPPPPLAKANGHVLVIGASTGGTEALRQLLEALPGGCPGAVIVQHMPENFTKAFADRLNELCVIEVVEAEPKMALIAGRAIIARGNNHLLLRKSGSRLYVEVTDGPLVCHHRPSVEVLFNSAAKVLGPNAIGIILTGMGRDGAAGLKNMRDAGARTIAQDEASCVVFGMPKEAIHLGAAERIVSLDKIPGTVFSLLGDIRETEN